MSNYNRALSIFEDPFFHHGEKRKLKISIVLQNNNSSSVLKSIGMEPRFGLGLVPSDFFSDRILPRSAMHHNVPTGYRRPWQIAREAIGELNKDQKSLQLGKDGFQACVDVHHFEPSEISVKTVDHTVIIEGKHEEREDGHGSVLRHFVRKYVLPKEFDMNSVQSSLSSDGVLTIKAPPPMLEGSGERHVAITHTNAPAHLTLKDNKPHAECGDAGKEK
jgi:crystallin alpha B